MRSPDPRSHEPQEEKLWIRIDRFFPLTSGDLKIVGAYYEVDTGVVTFG